MRYAEQLNLIPAGHHQIAQAAGIWIVKMNAWLGGVGSRLAGWRKRGDEMAELRGLNDRDLADIGLSRADMYAIQRGIWNRN